MKRKIIYPFTGFNFKNRECFVLKALKDLTPRLYYRLVCNDVTLLRIWGCAEKYLHGFKLKILTGMVWTVKCALKEAVNELQYHSAVWVICSSGMEACHPFQEASTAFQLWVCQTSCSMTWDKHLFIYLIQYLLKTTLFYKQTNLNLSVLSFMGRCDSLIKWNQSVQH